MARIDAAYDYFLMTYGNTLGTRYDTHKKSELRSTYNNIVKSNKNSPLYKLTEGQDVARFAIDIKESATQLQNTVSDLSERGEDISSMLGKRVAISSDDEVVEVKYQGNDDEEAASGFAMEVEKLAQPQINTGNFLHPEERNFETGTYSFDLNTKGNSYEFQINVAPGDNNLEVQRKVARLVNSANIGLKAEIESDDRGRTALTITSKQTGLAEGEEDLFNITSENSWRELNILGISKMSQSASNSLFKLNGNEHSSLSNTFTINRTFEVTLKGTSDEAVNIGFKANTDMIADGISNLLDSYNGMVEVGQKYSDIHGYKKLFNDVTAIAGRMSEDLAKVGIEADEGGKLKLNREKLSDAINEIPPDSAYEILNKFKDTVSREANKTAINPMNYVNKVVVEYKNPSAALAFPYAPSAYAGMLVDTAL